MTTFYKFPDEATFQAFEADVAVDVIGLIQTGMEGETPLHLDGFHVNALRPVPEWAQYEIEVTSPMRIFA